MTTWLQATLTLRPQGSPRSHAHDYLLLSVTITGNAYNLFDAIDKKVLTLQKLCTILHTRAD